MSHTQASLVATLGPDLQVDRVAQVEPTLGLHRVGEDADDVLVLPVELELQVTLVLLEVFGTHQITACRPGSRSLSSCQSSTATLVVRDTLMKRIRWAAEGP